VSGGCRQAQRRRARARRRILVTAALLAAWPPFPAAFPQSEPATGDAIVIGSIGDASRLLPLLASDSASGDIVGLLFNGLLKYNERLEVVGDLAESWTVSPDGLTLVFTLRPNLRWHDGVPVTAADVRFTYEKLIDPAVRTPFSSGYELVEAVEVLDARTLRVRYKEPFAPALESWMMGVIPKHRLEGQDLNTSPLLRRPVGHGPYRFVRWKTGELIELAANPDYFEHRPYIDRYLYRIIPDQATLFLELLTAGVDMSGLTPLQHQRQTSSPFVQRSYRKYRYPSFGFTYIGYNLQDARFSDVRVRRAINLAIDKQAILDGVLYGLGAVATGPYPQESWACNPDVAAEPRDPQAASALLAEAGWRDTDGDGWLDRDGRPFRFTLLTNQGNEVRRQVAELVQQQLKAVGIDAAIKIIEWSTFVHEFIDKRRFEAVLLGWNLSRDPDLYDLFHSSKTREGEYNFGGYANPEVDRLLIEGRRTFDREERRRIYREVHRRLYEDQPYTFLYVADALPIVSSRFRNVVATPAGIGHNFIEWYVPLAEQRYKRLAQ
jgi:peptide/nickel transport system substrate-binding protein